MASVKLDRRGFLFGIGATGALVSLPLSPTILEVWPRLSLVDMSLRLVGPITLAREPIDGHIPVEIEQITTLSSSAPEIDVTSLHSDAKSFVLGLADPGTIDIRGWISPEVQEACDDARILKAALSIPNPLDSLGRKNYFSFECLVMNIRDIDGRGA
jgi:hypothetical protein